MRAKYLELNQPSASSLFILDSRFEALVALSHTSKKCKSIVISYLWYVLVKDFILLFLGIAIFMTAFHIYQWIALHTLGDKFLQKLVQQASDTSPAKEESNYQDETQKAEYLGILVAALTFILGPFMFLVFSIMLRAFWFTSNYDFPLMMMPTIVIGDSIILPIFNLRFFKAIKHFSKNNIVNNKKAFVVYIIFAIVVSVILNSYTHYMWINDPYTGFMDIQQGYLTIAGWWHYGFSVVQMTIILVFLGLWFVAMKTDHLSVVEQLHKSWGLMIIFSAINLPEFFLKHFFIYKTFSLVESLRREALHFSPFLFTVSVWFFAWLWKKSSKNKKG